ncbi:Pectinesterase, catalytic [Sesbania bispinosa]|nr:Pectinesterase, catalytic [Sesbania bispinosa]
MDCGGKQVAKTITVDQHGKGDFKTIQAAIDSIKSQNDQWIKIHINSGTYKEKVSIPIEKPCIILEGAGRQNTIITYGDHQSIANSATFTSSPPNVVVSGITFKNSFNLARWSKLYKYKNGIEPAVAASVSGDKSAFFSCSFMGYQDTLLDSEGRHYFKGCYIQGEVDFIFGSGQSYYENCAINATQGNSLPSGFVTAQGRNSSNDPNGFVFYGGSIDGNGKVNLGRAWGPYSRVIFHRTTFSSVVTLEGWNAWSFIGHESNFIYAEVNCTGEGSNTSKRPPWVKKELSPSELNKYSLSSFINKDNWIANIPTLFL